MELDSMVLNKYVRRWFSQWSHRFIECVDVLDIVDLRITYMYIPYNIYVYG